VVGVHSQNTFLSLLRLVLLDKHDLCLGVLPQTVRAEDESSVKE